MFSDIRGYTPRSERMTPQECIAFLNRYFEGAVAAIHDHGGTVISFAGDGIMAIFGAPNRLQRPARSAIQAAIAMLDRLEKLNRELASDGIAPLAIGVSMAYSDAVVGNVGSRDRFNYTALGDGANVAARLQEVAKSSGFPVVATTELVEASGDTTGWTPLGRHPIRGHHDVDVLGWRP